MKKHGLIIDGKEIMTDKEFSVHDKYSKKELARISIAEKEHIKSAVKTAEDRFKSDTLSPYDRYEILNKTALIIKRRKEEIAKLLVQEVGKTIGECRIEVDRAIQTMILSSEEAKRIGGEIIPVSSSPGSENKFGYYIRVPKGVICAITPFNVPFNLSCHKIGPAIASGNTVVWKPASDTPLSAYVLMEILEEASLPKGYVNLVCGPGSSLGRYLLGNENISKYTFTGSPSVGKIIKEQSGFRDVSLELGSNSPNIINHDADIDLAAKSCVKWGFTTAGQACISVQRIYVHSNVKKDFLNKLKDYTNQIIVGNPMKEKTTLGPLISEKEAERVKSWIDDAVSEGANIISGGGRDGSFIEPTIIDNVKSNMKVVCEEIFGPVISILTFENFEEAIDMANDSEYGLQSGVFTSDIKSSMIAIKKLQTGGVIINDGSTYRADLMPYGGVKNSGIGKEGPSYAVDEMTDLKTVILNL